VPHKATFAWVYVCHRFYCGDYLRNRGTELCLVRCAKKAKKQIPDHLLDACGAMTQILRITCAGRQRK